MAGFAEYNHGQPWPTLNYFDENLKQGRQIQENEKKENWIKIETWSKAGKRPLLLDEEREVKAKERRSVAKEEILGFKSLDFKFFSFFRF